MKGRKKTKASPGILPAYYLEKISKAQHSEGEPRQRKLGELTGQRIRKERDL